MKEVLKYIGSIDFSRITLVSVDDVFRVYDTAMIRISDRVEVTFVAYCHT